MNNKNEGLPLVCYAGVLFKPADENSDGQTPNTKKHPKIIHVSAFLKRMALPEQDNILFGLAQSLLKLEQAKSSELEKSCLRLENGYQKIGWQPHLLAKETIIADATDIHYERFFATTENQLRLIFILLNSRFNFLEISFQMLNQLLQKEKTRDESAMFEWAMVEYWLVKLQRAPRHDKNLRNQYFVNAIISSLNAAELGHKEALQTCENLILEGNALDYHPDLAKLFIEKKDYQTAINLLSIYVDYRKPPKVELPYYVSSAATLIKLYFKLEEPNNAYAYLYKLCAEFPEHPLVIDVVRQSASYCDKKQRSSLVSLLTTPAQDNKFGDIHLETMDILLPTDDKENSSIVANFKHVTYVKRA